MHQVHDRLFSWSRLLLALVLLAPFVTPAAGDEAESEARKQVDFGIEVARSGLWREAIFRWQKAVELDPTNASARNNLGVAFEQNGQFELADEQYKRALDLAPDNIYIRQNYELFREAYERRKRKEQASRP